jgi:hypothetical protein
VTSRQRRKLFALAAALVLGSAAVLVQTHPAAETSDGGGPSDRVVRSAPELVGLNRAAPADTGDEPANPPEGRDQRRAARPIARRFVRALLQLQQDPTARRLPGSLASTTAPRLARSLLARPPRSHPPAPTRLGQIRLYGPFSGQIKASAWLREGRSGAHLLEVTLKQHAGGWRVTRVQP